MKRAVGFIALFLVLVAGVATAAEPRAVREQIVASMLVAGAIDIGPDGSVSAYELDHADKLTSDIIGFLDDNITQWRFEPVEIDGKVVRARARMSMRLVAKKASDKQHSVRIVGTNFGSYDDGESPRSRGKLKPPSYPEAAAYAGVGGTVYLVARIGRDGRVQDVVAEQVNLKIVASERDMQKLRDLFARSTIRTAKKWEFDPPRSGPEVNNSHWSVRVPVDFVAHGQKEREAWEWDAYVPGPRQTVPWRGKGDAGIAPDAIAAGGVYPDRPGGPRLLTPLDPSEI